MDPSLPRPLRGRTYAHQRRIRLADLDAQGRVRLDALARLLQDVAIEDVQETGWGTPHHLWFVRRILIHVEQPLLEDRALELVTWCSGLSTIAAGRRWSVSGDRGGRVEVDSVWVHLGPDQRPARITGFGVYAEAAGERAVSTKLVLPDPPGGSHRRPWALRTTDVDPHGHVNNAVHWQAVEDALAVARIDPRGALRAWLDYREPLDLGDEPELVTHTGESALTVALLTDERVKAVARIESQA
ncbi:MAG: acyl-ACP thioesterase domain-containing protein [Gaiella sp.]